MGLLKVLIELRRIAVALMISKYTYAFLVISKASYDDSPLCAFLPIVSTSIDCCAGCNGIPATDITEPERFPSIFDDIAVGGWPVCC